MTAVYLKRWNKTQLPWEQVLAGLLKKDYHIEECPVIKRDGYGKPYFEDCPLKFNVSHSGEYLAIAVSQRQVGIDIQAERSIQERTCQRVVRPEEQCLMGGERQRDFLRLWSMKESFIKAEGKGFHIPMRDYYIGKENGCYFVDFQGQRKDWQFYIEETLIPGYVISVCGLEEEVQVYAV